MLTWMLGLPFWGGVPVWGRKLAIYGAVGLAIFYALSLYRTRIWEQGARAGREAAISELEKKYKDQWKQEEKNIEVEKANLAEQRLELGGQAESIQQSRRSIDAALANALKNSRVIRDNSNAPVNTIPADQLDNTIRAISAELAASPAPK